MIPASPLSKPWLNAPTLSLCCFILTTFITFFLVVFVFTGPRSLLKVFLLLTRVSRSLSLNRGSCWLRECELAIMPAVFPRADEVKVKPLACNDKWCILVFALVITGMAGLTWWATAKEGANIERLIHPVDYSGQVCGYSPEVKDKPFLYVCGKANAGFEGNYPTQLDFQSRTCVSECPKLGGEVACIGKPLVTPYAVDSQDHNGINVHGVQVLKTVTWRVSQAVTYQKAYPTEPFRHMMCAPGWEAPNDLRDQIIFGAASPLSKSGEAFGSLLTAWPVLLAVFFIATVLSLLFLLLMTHYAGPVLFIAIVLADILIFLLGLFFAMGIFFDPFNTGGWYQSVNPIERTIYGEWARVLSLLVGVILCGMGVLLLHTLYHSSERIDEPVGLIHASMEFIFEPSGSSVKFLILVPFLSSIFTVAMVGFAILCFMLVLTAGPVDSRGIVIDGHHYPSMYKGIQKPWNGFGWDISMFLFVAGFIWLVELMVAVQQYTVTHCVCNWFFQPIKMLPSKEKEKEKNAPKKPDSHEVRKTPLDRVEVVGGIAAGIHKEGYIEHDHETGQKKMVVYLRDKGPNDAPYVPQDLESKTVEFEWIATGFCNAVTKKLGTLLYFCWYIFITRPLRVAAEVMRFLTTPASHKIQRKQFDEEEETKDIWGIMHGAASLFATFVNHEFGGYSKDAFVDIVLRDTNFREASKDASEQILSAGGVISFLHGMTRFYEIIASAFIVLLSTVLGFVVMENVPCFSDTNSSWYISDTSSMALTCFLISGIVAYSWMSLFNTTSDSLLYTLMWARKMSANDTSFPAVTRAQAQARGTSKVCPEALLDLVGEEASTDPLVAMKANAKNRSQATRFQHVGSRFKGAAMTTMGAGHSRHDERDPLLRKAKGSTTRH